MWTLFNLNLKYYKIIDNITRSLRHTCVHSWQSLLLKIALAVPCSALHINNPALTTVCVEYQQKAFRLVPSFLSLGGEFAQLSMQHKWHYTLFLWQDICCFQLVSPLIWLECAFCSLTALGFLIWPNLFPSTWFCSSFQCKRGKEWPNRSGKPLTCQWTWNKAKYECTLCGSCISQAH